MSLICTKISLQCFLYLAVFSHFFVIDFTDLNNMKKIFNKIKIQVLNIHVLNILQISASFNYFLKFSLCN